jgi:hypothetical protein
MRRTRRSEAKDLDGFAEENGPWRLEKLAALIEQNSACRLKAVGKGDSAAV